VLLGLTACSSDSDPSGPSAGGAGAGGASSGGAGATAAGSVSGGSAGALPNGGAGGEPAGTSGTGGAGSGAPAGASGSAGTAGASGSGGTPPFVEPTKLSETGLYADVAAGTLAAGVLEYRPKYELWSDTAVKRRWVYLPAGTQIDTSGTAPGSERSAPMDFWRYPVGTKLWKEFSRDGVRVETRLIQKYLDARQNQRWFMSAFVWNAAESDADATTDAVPNARGTAHDVPSRTQCSDCHDNMYDRVLGFSAVQLAHDLPGVKLGQLVSENRLTAAPAGPLTLPGTAAQQNALGYMHANCGHCHNENSQHAALGMVLWLGTGALADVASTPSVLTTLNVPAGGPQQPDEDLRIVPGEPAQSELYQRLTAYPPGNELHMPLIGSEMPDSAAISTIEAFIESL